MSKFWLAYLIASVPVYADTFKWRGGSESRLLYHTSSPVDTASHRHSLEVEATYKSGPFWTLHASGKAYAEGAFASNESRYGDDLRRRESQDLRLGDAYTQYKSGGWTLRGGNQQVIWGEAFGFYYADIINPKDLRELGTGPLNGNRISIPMLSTKYVSNALSFQALIIPKPYFNLQPAQGGDFSFPFSRFFPGATVGHQHTTSRNLATENFEGAIRTSALLGAWDFSLLFAYYFDRSAVYESTYTSPTTVGVFDRNDRLKTAGITTSVPCGPFICRSEILWHVDRAYGVFAAPNLEAEKSDEFVGVLGMDYTVSDRWYLGVQFSENYRNRASTIALSPRSQQNLSLHTRIPTFTRQKLETIFSYLFHDGSLLLQALYIVPISDGAEWLLSADIFAGGVDSQFGQYRRASRIGTQLKIYLSGEG